MPSKYHFDALINGDKPAPPKVASAMRVLHEVGYRPVDNDYLWVPGHVMYDRYSASLPADPCTRVEFGLAVRMCFPDAVRVVRRRASDGRKVRGWARVTGPGSEQSHDSMYWGTIKKNRSQSLTPPESVAE